MAGIKANLAGWDKYYCAELEYDLHEAHIKDRVRFKSRNALIRHINVLQNDSDVTHFQCSAGEYQLVKIKDIII